MVDRGVRIGQDRQPLVDEAVDFFGGHAVGDALGSFRIGAGTQTVVERLEGDSLVFELPFQVFIAVDADLAGVRKIRAELDEEGSEILIDALKVIVVDHDGRSDQMRIGFSGFRVGLGDGAKRLAFFLSFADQINAFLVGKLLEMLFGEIVFSDVFFEGNDFEVVIFGEVLDEFDESSCHLRHD